MWTSSGLTERDLNIPSGGNTNPTGSMGMKRGETVGIDQRHYFRDDVFAELNWVPSPTGHNPHKEKAVANIFLTIKGISYPQYNLDLAHDPRTTTTTYLQNNIVTHLSWGSAKPLITRVDLLGLKAKLYKRWINPTTVEYLMEID